MPSSDSEKGIISLVVVFGVGFLALSTAVVVTTTSLIELTKNKNTVFGNKSFYTAEAAAREGAYQYKKNPSLDIQDDTSVFGSDGLLNYSVSQAVTIKPTIWPYGEVIGVANNNITNRRVILTTTVFAEGEAFDYAAYSQNKINLGGNATINGSIFANNELIFTGNSAEVNGEAYSTETITDTDNINGQSFSNVDSILPPTIGITDYEDAASDAGTLFTETSDAENYLKNQTRTAVVFVDNTGTTKIQGNSTWLEGSLVVMGDLNIQGGTFTATGNYVAVYVEGNFSISGGTTINGIVYVKGSTSFGSGNNTINGSLLSAGETTTTDLTGSTTINYDYEHLYTPENWQDLLGLNMTSQEDPKITNWREE